MDLTAVVFITNVSDKILLFTSFSIHGRNLYYMPRIYYSKYHGITSVISTIIGTLRGQSYCS